LTATQTQYSKTVCYQWPRQRIPCNLEVYRL